MQIVCQTWLNLVTWTCGSWSEGQHDLYFTVQWFCLISWRLSDVCTSYFGSMNQYDPTFDLNKCRSLWPIFHGQVILHYVLKTFWCMNIILWDYVSVWSTFVLKLNVGLCDLYFMVQWCCLISPRLFDAWVSYFQIMRQCDPIFYLRVNISQHDQYFMV